MWMVKISELVLGIEFFEYGIMPVSLHGLTGIITAPLIHSSFGHLIANSVPLLILSTGIIYFYRDIAYKVLLLIYLISGFWVWLFARHAYHIGASGLVYGFASFLFFSGIIRKDNRMAAISFIVVFLYGSMVWGVFPIIPQISWESHLMGALVGAIIAVYYRKEGPQPVRYEWEDEDVEDLNEDNSPANIPSGTITDMKVSDSEGEDKSKINFELKK
jgi:membrane associated rhomboid family serine protease